MKVSKKLASWHQRLSLWVVAGVMMIGLLSASIFTASQAYADTSRDVNVNLTDKGYYISDAAAAKFTRTPVSEARSTLEKTVKELKDKNNPGAIALIDKNVFPPECAGQTAARCAVALRNLISKYEIMVVVTTDDQYGLSVKGLSEAETDQLVNSMRNNFTTKGPAEGARDLAIAASDKLNANAKAVQDASTGNTMFIIGAVVVFLLIIGGLGAFLVSQTRKNWKAELVALNDESRQVNDMIYQLSGDVDYMFGANADRVKQDFSQATRNISSVNEDLRQLEGLGSRELILGWGKWRSKRDETKAKLETTRRTLAQVSSDVEEVKRLT